MTRFSKICIIFVLACLGTAAIAQTLSLPDRQGPRPKTTRGVPHVQIDVTTKPELTEELLRRVDTLPGVNLGATRVSLPGAVGFQLARDMRLAHPEVIVGGREFAHIHPDGSLHASLDPKTAQAAIDAGWAVSHPWANKREGWEGFVMIYAPQTKDELTIVHNLVKASYSFVTGNSAP